MHIPEFSEKRWCQSFPDTLNIGARGKSRRLHSAWGRLPAGVRAAAELGRLWSEGPSGEMPGGGQFSCALDSGTVRGMALRSFVCRGTELGREDRHLREVFSDLHGGQAGFRGERKVLAAAGRCLLGSCGMGHGRSQRRRVRRRATRPEVPASGSAGLSLNVRRKRDLEWPWGLEKCRRVSHQSTRFPEVTSRLLAASPCSWVLR